MTYDYIKGHDNFLSKKVLTRIPLINKVYKWKNRAVSNFTDDHYIAVFKKGGF